LVCDNAWVVVRLQHVEGIPCQHESNISISNLVPARITVSFGSKDGICVLRSCIG
jgi:hypothetical protein